MDEFDIYGQQLTGDETQLEREKLRRVQYLKNKMRTRLTLELGDDQDTIADLTRAVVLGLGIAKGTVTDQTVIDRYNLYLQDMLDGYGGAEAIMDVLEDKKTAIEQHVVMGYYLAKQDILAVQESDYESRSAAIDAVRSIDLPGEPEIDGEE